jgi:hypothetical protein
LISLELIEETNLTTGICRHRGGALIINGDWAGIVLGRAEEIPEQTETTQLRDLIKIKEFDPELCKQVFNFETSVAQGNLDNGFNIAYSTQASRLNQSIFNLNGFEIDENKKEVIHTFEDNEAVIQRRFTIDTLEPSFNYSPLTKWSGESQNWFKQEQQTIGRYLEIIK